MIYNGGAPTAKEVAELLSENIPDHDVKRLVQSSLQMAPDIVKCVKAFHRLYGMPILRPSEAQDDFSHITPDRLAMRFGLIVEEFIELCDAMDIKVDMKFSYLNEDEMWVEAKDHIEAVMETENRDLPAVADATCDLKYVIVGFELEMGIDPHAVLEEVQASNMTKNGDDGVPIRREDGKIMKGPNYIVADVATALKGRGLRSGSLGPLSTAKGMEQFA